MNLCKADLNAPPTLWLARNATAKTSVEDRVTSNRMYRRVTKVIADACRSANFMARLSNLNIVFTLERRHVYTLER